MPELTTHRRTVSTVLALVGAFLLALAAIPLIGGSSPALAQEEETPQETIESSPTPTPQPEQCVGGAVGGELPSGARSISGTISDADGFVGELAGIQVQLHPSAGGIGSTQTDGSGAYTFSGIADGSYLVTAFDPSGTYKSGFLSDSGQVLTAAEADPVVVAGTDRTGIDMALPVELRAAMVGSVSANNGDPVPAVKVQITGVTFPGLVGCGSTQGGGGFNIGDLRAGAYRIQLVDPSGAFPTGFYSGSAPGSFTTDFAQSTAVVIDGVDVEGLAIQYPVLYSVSGTVADADANPVSGLQVIVCDPPISGNCRSGSTDEFGEYTVAGLPAGSYLVLVAGAPFGYLNAWFDGPGEFTLERSDAEPVPVADNVIGLDLLAVPAPIVSGTVTDSGGAPVEFMLVSLTDEMGEGAGAYTDVDGDYAISVQPGTYLMQLTDFSGTQPSGYRDASGSLVGAPADAELVAVDLEDVADVDVSLPQPGALEATISVNDSPLMFGNVSLCLDDSFCTVESFTNEEGAASFPAVLPGTYIFRAFDENGTLWFHVDGSEASENAAEASPVTITAGRLTTVTMTIETGPPGTETPPGPGVEVELDDGTGATPVGLTFDNVDSAGTTTLTIPPAPPDVPSGFQFGDPPTYYEIETTATFTGDIEVCVTFDPGAYADPAGVRLFHGNEVTGVWDDITVLPVDVITAEVCGLTDSLSPFALAERSYAFGKFFGPKLPPTLNQATAGDIVGIQFTMDAGFIGLDLFETGGPTSEQIDCVTGEVIPGSDSGQTSADALKFNAKTGRYTFPWVTARAWRNTCRELTLTFHDGTSQSVWFKFKR